MSSRNKVLNVKVFLKSSESMVEVENESVHLIVTSPPYPKIPMWTEMFKAVGCSTYREMHDYLARIWRECYRVLVYGGKMAINIGDALLTENKLFRLYPNHATIMEICGEIGFTILPYILWKKIVNRPNSYLGSGMLPPNAYVTQDCEFILIFQKGNPRKFPPKDEKRYASKYTQSERDIYFSQIWTVGGTRQENPQIARRTAAFPSEIPRRLIKMYSVLDDVVLDPFVGLGTTLAMARDLGRSCIGYEIQGNLSRLIQKTVKWGRQILTRGKITYSIH